MCIRVHVRARHTRYSQCAHSSKLNIKKHTRVENGKCRDDACMCVDCVGVRARMQLRVTEGEKERQRERKREREQEKKS